MIYAQAIHGVCYYREVTNGFIERSLAYVFMKETGAFTLVTYTRHNGAHASHRFETQKEVSQFTADYFGL